MAHVEILVADDFAARLLRALQACNLSRAQLASTLGVNKSLVSRWLSGEMKPSSYNLARISALIAKLKPGFNMTLWEAPQAEFEAALGLTARRSYEPPPDHFETEIVPDKTDAHEGNGAMVTRPASFGWANAFLAGAAVVSLVVFGILAWQRAIHSSPSPKGMNAPGYVAASVAVMPFLNMSGDPAKEYLGDGISEEILNDLANTPNLQVAARTSSFSFKGSHSDIAEIARKLNVRAVLEGSVRQQGDRIRIVAQLIDATDGFHLWSASYDRKVDDLLTVQDQIARTIVAELTGKLFPGRVATAAYSPQSQKHVNPDAYDAYLQGLFWMNKSAVGDKLRAVDLFKQAIKLEPDYLDAHARLASAYVGLFLDMERRDTLGPAHAQIAYVLKSDPDNFPARLADAQLKQLLWQWNDADAAIRKLLLEHPRNAELHQTLALFFEELDLWDEAVTEHRRAAELDPLVPLYRDNFGQALRFVGRDREAFVQFKQVLALEPNYVLSLGNICNYYAVSGQLQDARRVLHDKLIPLYADDPNRFVCASLIAYRGHDTAELQRTAQSLERLYARGALAASLIAYPYAFMGDYENAMGWLEKAYDDQDSGLFFVVADPFLPKAMQAVPRWQRLMQRPAFREIARVRAQILARGR